jgi:TonB family protein
MSAKFFSMNAKVHLIDIAKRELFCRVSLILFFFSGILLAVASALYVMPASAGTESRMFFFGSESFTETFDNTPKSLNSVQFTLENISGGREINGPEDAIKLYKRLVRVAIEQAQQYPSLARKQGMEGLVRVRFTINRRGSLVNYSIMESSGHDILDFEAIKILERASPFPMFPPEITHSEMTLTAPILFRLRREY